MDLLGFDGSCVDGDDVVAQVGAGNPCDKRCGTAGLHGTGAMATVPWPRRGEGKRQCHSQSCHRFSNALPHSQVIKMVVKCGETPNEAQQLAVVRALLTFTTAEHFIPHGEVSSWGQQQGERL